MHEICQNTHNEDYYIGGHVGFTANDSRKLTKWCLFNAKWGGLPQVSVTNKEEACFNARQRKRKYQFSGGQWDGESEHLDKLMQEETCERICIQCCLLLGCVSKMSVQDRMGTQCAEISYRDALDLRQKKWWGTAASRRISNRWFKPDWCCLGIIDWNGAHS